MKDFKVFIFLLIVTLLTRRPVFAQSKKEEEDGLPGQTKNFGPITVHPSNNISQISSRALSLLDVRTLSFSELDFNVNGEANFFVGKDVESLEMSNYERKKKLDGIAVALSNGNCKPIDSRNKKNYEIFLPDRMTACDIRYFAIYSVDKNFVHAYWKWDEINRGEIIAYYGKAGVKDCPKKSTAKVSAIGTKKCPWENPNIRKHGSGQNRNIYSDSLVWLSAAAAFTLRLGACRNTEY